MENKANTIHIIIAEPNDDYRAERLAAVDRALVGYAGVECHTRTFTDAAGALEAIREIGSVENVILVIGDSLQKPMDALALLATLRTEELLPIYRLLCAEGMPARNSHPEVSAGLYVAGRTSKLDRPFIDFIGHIVNQPAGAHIAKSVETVVPPETLAVRRAAHAYAGKESRAKGHPGP